MRLPRVSDTALRPASFFVVMNALRLNLIKPHDASKDRAKGDKIKDRIIIQDKEGDKNMTITIKVEGMMCGHCEARVKKAVEALEGVTSAKADHEAGTVVIEAAKEISEEVLKKAIEDQDYTFCGVVR